MGRAVDGDARHELTRRTLLDGAGERTEIAALAPSRSTLVAGAAAPRRPELRPSDASAPRPVRSFVTAGDARDHHFGRLHDRQRFVAASQLQLVDGVARDHRRQRLAADAKPHLRQQSVDPDFLDHGAQLISSAQRDDAPGAVAARCAAGRGPVERAGDRSRRPRRDDARRRSRVRHRSLVDPLLERRIADAQAAGSLARSDRSIVCIESL